VTSGTRAWRLDGSGLRSDLEVSPSGFKHLLVPLFALAVGARSRCTIRNVPDILETSALCSVARELGLDAHHDVEDRALAIVGQVTSGVVGAGASADGAPQAAGTIHGSMYLVPVLAGIHGAASLLGHGGCAIGAGPQGTRPIAHIASIIERFGASCELSDQSLRAVAPHGLRATTIDLGDYSELDSLSGTPTGPLYSGATKAAILAAAVAEGTTVLHQPYPKPDVAGLVDVLDAIGMVLDRTQNTLVISGAGGPVPGFDAELPSDLLEVVSYLSLAVHCRRPIRMPIIGVPTVRAGLAAELATLDKMGLQLDWSDDDVAGVPPERARAVTVHASSHRCYSDSQPLLAAALIDADGTSELVERVWPGRFSYADELAKVGAVIEVSNAGASIVGQPELHPSADPMLARDLRAAMALVIAAIGRGRPQVVCGVQHLERGYARLDRCLRAIGVEVVELPAGSEVSGASEGSAPLEVQACSR